MPSNKGFSLLEIAIMLVLLGLIALGFPYLRSMIASGEATEVGARAQAYGQAGTKFRDAYGYLPGDLPEAGTFLPGVGANADGDGDGRLDENNIFGYDETTLFWRHLAASELLLDQALALDPASHLAIGLEEHARFHVFQDQSHLIMEYAALSASNVPENAILLPASALTIDERLDDGNPTGGWVRGVDGADTPGSCIVSGDYDLSVDYVACRLRFDLTRQQPQQASAEASTAVACGFVGERRFASHCPDGYIGYVLETCTEEGVWQTSHRECEPVRCSQGGSYGEVRTMACPPGYQGQVSARCMAGGMWGDYAYNCTPAQDGQPCAMDGTTLTYACPMGQTGANYYTCMGGVWTLHPQSQCAPLTCGAYQLGQVDNGFCSAGFQGRVVTSCSLTGVMMPSVSNCYAQQGVGCSVEGEERVLPCSVGQEGKIVQHCRSGSGGGRWVTTSDECQQATCGGAMIGSIRPTRQPCPSGYTGTLYEFCNDQGEWETTDVQCARIRCSPEAGGTAGNATWPWADADDSAVVTGGCLSGYSGTAQRHCLSDGRWSGTIATCL